MLESIRSSAQSFGVKIAFGIIILVFVFWGVGNFNDRDYSNVVAVVNGEPIVATEFEKAYQNAEEYMLRNNPGLTREQLVKDHLGRQVLKDLINATLLAQEADRASISVSPLELRQAVGKIKAFQDANNKFDPEAYKRVLEAQRLTPAQYEKELSSQLLQDKIYNLITAPVWVDPEEAKNIFNYMRERRKIDYLFIQASEYLNKVTLDPKTAGEWYEANKESFMMPPKVNVEYISISPQELVNKDEIDLKTATQWYETNRKNFETKEQVRVSHILVPVANDANEAALAEARNKLEKARAEIKNGKTFAAVADKINQTGAGGPGGELGWINRGETDKNFEEAAFQLSPGEISEIVRTPFGLHIIYMQDKKAGGIKTFDEVKDQVYETLAHEKGLEKIHDAVDNLIEDNILNKPMPESAAKYNLKVQDTGFLEKDELIKSLGISEDDAKTLLEKSSGESMDTALEAGNKSLIVRIKSLQPAAIKPFEQVKDNIEKQLKLEKALELALKEATDILGKISREPITTIKAEYKDFKTGVEVNRGIKFADFEYDASLNEAIFSTHAGMWLSRPYLETDAKDSKGYILVKITEIMHPEAGEFVQVEEILKNAARRDRMEAIFAMFLEKLQSNAKIEITNTNLIDRTAR